MVVMVVLVVTILPDLMGIHMEAVAVVLVKQILAVLEQMAM